jgi:hypothetical protein
MPTNKSSDYKLSAVKYYLTENMVCHILNTFRSTISNLNIIGTGQFTNKERHNGGHIPC